MTSFLIAVVGIKVLNAVCFLINITVDGVGPMAVPLGSRALTVAVDMAFVVWGAVLLAKHLEPA